MIDIENLGRNLKISYWDKEGKLQFKTIEVPKNELFKWQYCSPSDKNKDLKFKSWDNKPVKRTPCSYLDKFRVDQFLTGLPESETKDIFDFNIPKKFFIDIEVEVTDSFPEPAQAPNQVTTIAITSEDQQILVLGLKDLSPAEIADIEKDINKHFEKFDEVWKFKYVKMNSEYHLLFTFFSQLVPKMPIITGWNIINFDWIYLKNRCKKLNIHPEIASPSKKLTGQDELPLHRLIVDYMQIYKKYDYTIKIKENYSLDYTGERVIGLKKIKYNGTIQQMYENDFKKYVFYNAVDTTLVYYIDKELNTLLTFLMISNIAKIEANKAFSSIRITESLMAKEFLKRDKVLFNDDSKQTVQKSYEGAYVKDPIKGMHEWVASFDFASLYPSTMRQFNISPETYKGMNVELQENWVKTASGAVFDQTEDSVLKTVLSEQYDGRVKVKSKWKKIDKEIEILKNLLKTK